VVQRQVMATLARVQQELGAAVILVGHDMGLMAQFVDRLGIMYAGRLVEVAPIADIIARPRHPYTRALIAALPSLEARGPLAGLSLAIDAERPSVIAVVGESGSGKTTLARLLLGLVEPTEGMVRYRGQDLRRLGREARRTFRRDVQAIFQDPYGVYNPFYRV